MAAGFCISFKSEIIAHAQHRRRWIGGGAILRRVEIPVGIGGKAQQAREVAAGRTAKDGETASIDAKR